MNRIFLAGLLGCISMFTWEYIAYTALPLGFIGFRKLPNETAVLAALQNNIAENSGIYFFPDAWLGTNPPEKKAEASNDFAEKIWEINFDTGTNALDVMMRRLRAKVDDPFEKKMIQTIRGVGYVLRTD